MQGTYSYLILLNHDESDTYQGRLTNRRQLDPTNTFQTLDLLIAGTHGIADKMVSPGQVLQGQSMSNKTLEALQGTSRNPILLNHDESDTYQGRAD